MSIRAWGDIQIENKEGTAGELMGDIKVTSSILRSPL